jgi:hypothetical protein
VISGHAGGEVGGGKVLGTGLVTSPLQQETVGQTGEDGMGAAGLMGAQAARAIAVGDVERAGLPRSSIRSSCNPPTDPTKPRHFLFLEPVPSLERTRTSPVLPTRT